MNAAIGDRKLTRSGGAALMAALLAGLAAFRLPERPDRRTHHHRHGARVGAEHLVADGGHRPQPQDPEAYNVRGSAYGRGGKYREALKDFDKAIELNPNFYQAYANRALIHRFLGDQAERARRLQPLDPAQCQL